MRITVNYFHHAQEKQGSEAGDAAEKQGES
jgi:hypothetical protein